MADDDKKIGLSRMEFSRREFMKIAGATGAAIGLSTGLGSLVAACAEEEEPGGQTSSSVTAGEETGREIKIGYVAPLTGMLAVFGVADQYCFDRAQEGFAAGVVCGDGKKHPVTLMMQDSQSDSNRAAQVAGDLIANDQVDIIMAASTGINVAPVADQAEANQVPCLSTDCPWQNYVFPRGGNPTTEWQWTYNAFWGTEDIIATFMDIWGQVSTNKKVAIMFPNDALGIPWLDAFQQAVPAAGWDPLFTDLYTPGSEDFSAQISSFKRFGAEILMCEANPPDFTTFWKQCLQQSYLPKVNCPAVALAFPETAAALGDIADNLCGELGWHPKSGFTSPLLGENAQQFADTFTEVTGNQWNQSLVHFQVFDWAYDVLQRTADVDDKTAIIDAVKATKLDTIGGPIDFTQPVDTEIRPGVGRVTPNCYKTPLFGNQWRKTTGGQFPFEATIVSNVAGSMVPVQDAVREMVYS